MGDTLRGPAAGPSLIGVGAVAAAAAVLRASQPVLSGIDPFWHWDMGRRILDQGLPREDPYSFLTSGREWIVNQWGTELAIGVARASGGIWLVAVLAALLVGGAVLLTGWAMWRRSPSLVSLALLVLVVAATVTNWSLRGNLFTFVLLPLLLMELRREGGARPWLVFVLLVVWANMHAAFLLGVALITLDAAARVFVADDRRASVRRGTLVVIPALAAGLVTPYGPRFLVSVLELSVAGAGGIGISEWQPTAITRPATLPFTLVVALVLIAVAIAATRDDLPDVVLIVAGALFGISAMRNVAAGAITLGIVGAPYLRRTYVQLRGRPASEVPRPPNRVDRALFASLCMVGVLLALLTVPRSSALQDHVTGVPLELIQELDALDRPARVFTTSRWAAAVGALTGDHVTIAVDGRLELFTDEEFEALLVTEGAGHGWEGILRTWCATDLILPRDSRLIQAIEDRDGWRVAARSRGTKAVRLASDHPAGACSG